MKHLIPIDSLQNGMIIWMLHVTFEKTIDIST